MVTVRPRWRLSGGTAIGLALAHWFAFVVAGVGFAGGKVLRHDLRLAGAQVVGAAVVAAATTVPVVLVDDESQVDAALFAPALILGVAGYLVGRDGGRSAAASIVAGVVALGAGLLVASIKTVLAGH